MTGHFILADMTSHRRGFGVQPIISAAARRAQANNGSGKIIWLVPSHLANAFSAENGAGGGGEIRNCDNIGPALWPVIQSELQQIQSTVRRAEITVVTWDPFIHDRVHGYGPGVSAAKWSDWIRDNRVSPVAKQPAPLQLRLSQIDGAAPSVEQLQEAALTYLIPFSRTRSKPLWTGRSGTS